MSTEIKRINRLLKKLLRKGYKEYTDRLDEAEKELLKAYKEALKNVRYELSEMYRKYGDSAKYSEMAKYNRLTNLEKAIAEQIVGILGVCRKIVASAMKDVFELSFYNVEYSVNAAFNLKVNFAKLSPDLVKKALDNPLDRIKWQGRLKLHHEKAIRQINSEIAQGLIQGKGYAKTARAITERVNGLANNALRIVRTETHRVQTEGKLAGFDKAENILERKGYKVYRVLDSVIDSRTRPQSRSMDGQRADENGLFTYPNGVKARGPGLTGVPEYDINDRETVLMEVES